ncbi:MAG TPA: DUF87 domain-containing protein [Ktedonobacterales bacterium]|nr:DUF87 domain-containing protein [Ktedonobacterales bacterium]
MAALPSITIESRQAATALAVRHAYFGYVLHSVAPGRSIEHLADRANVLTRLESALGELPGSSRAIDLRYVVSPATLSNGWQEQVRCYLLARLSDWGRTRGQLRLRAQMFAVQLQQILAHSLAGYAFLPLTHPSELAAARQPFVVADTGELRRRIPEQATFDALPHAFLGLPDAESLVEMMVRQATPTLLSICIEPFTHGAQMLPVDDGSPPESRPASIGAVRHNELTGDLTNVEAMIRVHQDVSNATIQVQRLAALRQRAFRLRIQLAGADMLDDALIATLAGEIGGPGIHTAQAAWQDPRLSVAAGAAWAVPRATRAAGSRQTEQALALENLRGIGFTPWGADAARVAEGQHVYLADLGEATRLLALPGAAPWLPGHGHALALPLVGAATTGVRLGHNPVRGLPRPVLLPDASRAQHLWILGQTGTGKSTLLESLVLQDIQAHRGVILLDPHGDLINEILGKIPASRAKDVILFDPSDTEYPLGINPLEATTDAERALVVSSFLGLLKRLYDPHEQGIVGPRFEHGVRNGMLTVMSRPGATLVEFVRVLTDDRFLKSLLPHVTDPIVKRYWTDQIAHTSDFHRSEVLDYTVSKFGRWVTDPTIRRIIGQPQSSFSFRDAMDSGKIVLLSLAKGMLGGDDANFLGLILLPKILQAALSRVTIREKDRRDVTLYIDEFQNYATDALALMLAEARKYHVSLTLANQHMGQLTPEIRDAVIGNVGSLIAFRLGLKDAAAMEEILAPSPVLARHLNDLPNFTAYSRLLVGGQRTPAFLLATEPVTRARAEARARRVRGLSRKTYGRAKADVDADMERRAQL